MRELGNATTMARATGRRLTATATGWGGWLVLALLSACGGGNEPLSAPTPPMAAAGLQVTGEALVGRQGSAFKLLANDRLNGAEVVAGADAHPTVTFRLLTPASPPPGLQISDAGVATPLWDVGRWVLQYEVCDAATLGSAGCHQATATLETRLGALTAADDVFRLHVGGTPGNVLANDTATRDDEAAQPLRPGSGTEVMPLGPLPRGVTLSASGQVTVTQAAPVAQPVRFDYRVCSLPTKTDCATAQVQVERADTTLVTGTMHGTGRVAIAGAGRTRTDSLPCASEPACQRYRIEVAGDPEWVIPEQVIDGLRLPLGRWRTQPGQHLEVLSEYFVMDHRHRPVDRGTYDAINTGVPFWESATDAAGHVRRVAYVKRYFLYGQLDMSAVMAGFDAVDDESTVDLRETFALTLQFSDGSPATAVQGGLLHHDTQYLGGSTGVTPLPDDAMWVLRYDEVLRRWKVHAPAERIERPMHVLRYQGPFTGPGIWAIGRVLRGTTVRGCVVDTQGRAVSGGHLFLYTTSKTAVVRTGPDGRFVGRMPAGEAVTVDPRLLNRHAALDGAAVIAPASDSGVIDLTPCIEIPTAPPVSIEFPGATLVEPDPWTGEGGLNAETVIAGPDGRRMHHSAQVAMVGRYRLYHPRTPGLNRKNVPDVTVHSGEGETQVANAGLPLDDGPGWWHAYDVVVAADCSVSVHRVGVAVSALPALASHAVPRCVRPS